MEIGTVLFGEPHGFRSNVARFNRPKFSLCLLVLS